MMPIKKGKGKGILMLIYFSHDFFQFSTSEKQDCHMKTPNFMYFTLSQLFPISNNETSHALGQ